MAKFPDLPSSLSTIRAVTSALPTGALLWRIYFRGGPHPTAWNSFRAFGPSGARFDHQIAPPSSQAREILYAAQSGPTCFAEVYQDTRVIDRTRRDPWLVGFELARSVVLLDLTGTWPTQAGASMAIHSGPRSRARRWSQAIYSAYPTVEGLLYCSSMNANKPAVALYERARTALPARPMFHRSIGDPLLAPAVARAAQAFNYAIV